MSCSKQFSSQVSKKKKVKILHQLHLWAYIKTIAILMHRESKREKKEDRNIFRSIASTYSSITRCTNIQFTSTCFLVSILVMQPALKIKLKYRHLFMRFAAWHDLTLLLSIFLLLQGILLLLSKHVLPTWFNWLSKNYYGNKNSQRAMMAKFPTQWLSHGQDQTYMQ